MSADVPLIRPAQFEFTSLHNDLFRRLAGKMRGVGAVNVLIGLLNLMLAGMVFLAGQNDPKLKEMPPTMLWAIVGYYAVMGVVMLAVGGWTWSAGGSFRQVANTTGQDVTHLMDGLGTLYKAYSLIYTLYLVAILATGLAVLGMVAVAVMAKPA